MDRFLGFARNDDLHVCHFERSASIRDSKRLQRWPARVLAWGIGLTVPRDFRVHYWGSIRASYTPDELRALLARSALRDGKIVEDWMDLMIVKEG